MSDATKPVWMVRGGPHGEDEPLALNDGLAVIGFGEIPDLTGLTSFEQLVELVRKSDPGSDARTRTRASQLKIFALKMSEGDVVVMPLKSRSGRVAFGRVVGPYKYQSIDGVDRHTRKVDWIRPDVPRADIEQDLLYSLGAFLTVCRIQRNEAERRLGAVLRGESDPGFVIEDTEAGDVEPSGDLVAPIDLGQFAHDQVCRVHPRAIPSA